MNLLTEVSEEGIRQPTWGGVVFWKWEEITEATIKGKYMEVKSGTHSIRMFDGMYKNTMEIWLAVLKRVDDIEKSKTTQRNSVSPFK